MAAARPNFFIVGAPKCGRRRSTSTCARTRISSCRRSRSRTSSPRTWHVPVVKTPEAYTPLFAAPEAAISGWARRRSYTSARRWRSPTSASTIPSPAHRDVPEPGRHGLLVPLAVALRGPGDRQRFRTAWRFQEDRSRGMDLPAAPAAASWCSTRTSAGSAPRRGGCSAIFPREQVRMILYDDFSASPQLVYDEVIEFLGIPRRPHRVPRINEDKRANGVAQEAHGEPAVQGA